MDRLLLHTCCAPCSVYCVDSLRGEGIEPVSFWYNPNIHPYQEYRARRDTLIEYDKSMGLELIVRDNYGLRDFVRAVAGDLDHRCGRCYTCRLEETARYAAENGFTHFSTTLLVSPYQNHDGICRTAEALAAQYGVEFLYRDFRPGFRQGQAKPGSWASTCRNIAAAYSPRRSGTQNRSPGTRKNSPNKNPGRGNSSASWIFF